MFKKIIENKDIETNNVQDDKFVKYVLGLISSSDIEPRKFVINTLTRTIAIQDGERFHVDIVKSNWPELLVDMNYSSERAARFVDDNKDKTIIGGLIDINCMTKNKLEINFCGYSQNKFIYKDHDLAVEIMIEILKRLDVFHDYETEIDIIG